MPSPASKNARRALSILCASSALCISATAAAQEPGTRLTARLSAGFEYDDNVLRTTLTDLSTPRADGLSRYFAALDMAHREGAIFAALQLRQGGKLFWAEQDANALLTQATLVARYQLGESWSLGATLDAKDRTERRSILDYTRGAATLDLAAQWRRVEVSAGVGWRMFIFKPSPDASTDGAGAQLNARILLAEPLSLQLGYSLTLRDFTTARFVQAAPDPESPDALRLVRRPGEARRDQFHSASAGLQWQGPVVLELVYQYAANRSNSYGQGLQRHSADVTLTAPLWWELYLSANVGLQRTLYDNPVLIDANFRVDEENRNQAVLALQRPFLERWDAELRYSIFGQEFGAGGDYGRQTWMLAVGYTYD